MGSSISEMSTGTNNKQRGSEPKLTSKTSTENGLNASAPPTATCSSTVVPSTTPIAVKTPQEKCAEISTDLTNLDAMIDAFVGKRDDKNYLKLDELLTRCKQFYSILLFLTLDVDK